MRFTQRKTIDKSEMDKRTRQDAAICALDPTLPLPVPAGTPFGQRGLERAVHFFCRGTRRNMHFGLHFW